MTGPNPGAGRRTAHQRIAIAALLLPTVPVLAAQTTVSPTVEPRIEQGDKAAVEQLSQSGSAGPVKGSADAVSQIRPATRQSAEMAQLPPDAVAAPSATSPEEALEATLPPSPRADLYRDVALVWELIRKRGQQPTPELIAREIGPDNLARFLSDFPAAANMFGVDSDAIPVAPPDAVPPSGSPPDK